MIFINNHPISNRRYNNRASGGLFRSSTAAVANNRVNDAQTTPQQQFETHAQLVEFRRQFIVKRREFIDRKIKELPALYLILTCAAVFSISIALIAIQSVQIGNNAQTSSIASGIWVGAFYFLAGASTILLIFFRTYTILMASYVIYFIGIFLCIIASVATSPYRKDSSVDGLNVTLIVLECLDATLSIAFVIVAKCLTCYTFTKSSTHHHGVGASTTTSIQQQRRHPINAISNLNSSNNMMAPNDAIILPPPTYSFHPDPAFEEVMAEENPPVYNPEKFPYPRSPTNDTLFK